MDGQLMLWGNAVTVLSYYILTAQLLFLVRSPKVEYSVPAFVLKFLY